MLSWRDLGRRMIPKALLATRLKASCNTEAIELRRFAEDSNGGSIKYETLFLVGHNVADAA